MRDNYNFNISLSVLNHLGRNLYRNVITVLGEAISNSWDADAKNVYITIDRENNYMSIQDDGLGMTDDDFQEKFLKIGYSKRKKGDYTSPSGRPFIGRKGIGKLALLSCAKRVSVATKANGCEVVGGIIDNSSLDKAITDDLIAQEYVLEPLKNESITKMSTASQGTLIEFETISDGIGNTVEYIKKAIALYFRFSLIDKEFKIHINGVSIDESQLLEFADKTQFLWRINDISDPFLDKMSNLLECKYIRKSIKLRGYIASVEKPSHIKIRGAQEKVTIDLFVNGRLRERDILRHIPTARIVENYVYGQIHCDFLDAGNGKDIFTSSREGIISDDPMFKEILDDFGVVFKQIIEEWDVLRRKYGNDGDPDNKTITPKARKAQELFNTTLKDMESGGKFVKKGSVVEEWAKKLSEEAQFNVPSYTECFIAENLLRQYIDYAQEPLSPEATKEANKWRNTETTNKSAANISYDVRQSGEDVYYLDMAHLANLIDKAPDKLKDAALSRSATVYKPMRDAVGHTSLLTPLAKSQLSVEYENIKARLVQLLQDLEKNKPTVT